MTTSFLSELTGLFASPAAENPTGPMIEAAYRHHNMNFRYITCEVSPEMLGDAVRGARAMGWAGFHCSIPHKVAVIGHLDGLGESAEIMQAVNTVVRRGNLLIGENTDGKGFVQAVRELTDPAGKSICLFGAGGAARAVGVELALAGADNIIVVNRSRQRGQELVNLLNERTPANSKLQLWDKTITIPNSTDIVINATSIGLYPDVEGRLDIDMSTLRSRMLVVDGIHNPPKTLFLRDAETLGCAVLDGLGMLVNQGVISVKYWTTKDVDPSIMRQTVRELLLN